MNTLTAMEPRPTPNFVYCNGDVLSFRVSNTSEESETLSFQHSIDEMLLHVLEKQFSGMKAQAEQKKKELFKKMEAGGLNEDEEEWLDNEGNMVDEFLLMERLKEITPNNQHIPISASDIEIIKKISLFETEHTQGGEKDALPSTQKKTSPAAPLEKKKKSAAPPSPKRKQSLRKGLKSAGAAVQGTALSTRIEANTDPRKLLNRISTNQKDIVHKELAGKVAPIRPEGKESDLDPSEGTNSSPQDKSKPKIAIKRISFLFFLTPIIKRSLAYSLSLPLSLSPKKETSLK
ncbi:hypothetical protein MJO29_016921 [Puccinia striiformis f. sp. tritici]|nr:hypothetical protein MJO29_016921 [Puccinia striiformis f. sp. tritici]